MEIDLLVDVKTEMNARKMHMFISYTQMYHRYWIWKKKKRKVAARIVGLKATAEYSFERQINKDVLRRVIGQSQTGLKTYIRKRQLEFIAKYTRTDGIERKILTDKNEEQRQWKRLTYLQSFINICSDGKMEIYDKKHAENCGWQKQVEPMTVDVFREYGTAWYAI